MKLKYQIKFIVIIGLIIIFIHPFKGFSSEYDNFLKRDSTKTSIEIFPIVTIFSIYSFQYLIKISPKNELIIGFTFLNNYFPNSKNAIGRFYAPTFPIGVRNYFYKNFHLEIQFWPSYDFYFDKLQKKIYNSFDLTMVLRSGYKFDFKEFKIPLYVNIQLEYVFGLLEGKKPESFRKKNI